MRKKKRAFLFCFAIFHLFIILLAATISNYSTAREYFNEDEALNGKKKERDNIEKAIFAILELPGVTPYAMIAGIDAGYGFFAPNVASSYIIECIQKDKNNVKINSLYLPEIRSHEGALRYETLISTFQERMKSLKYKDNKNLYSRYLDIIIKSIGKQILENNPDPRAVQSTVTLHLYSYPMLNQYIMGKQDPKLISLVSFDIKRK